MCALGKTLFYIIYITGIVELPNINVPRLATSQLANIFGNDTIHRHGKKRLKRAKNPEINRINRALKARASFEVPKPQVHSLIFLVMIRYTGTIKKIDKGKKTQK